MKIGSAEKSEGKSSEEISSDDFVDARNGN